MSHTPGPWEISHGGLPNDEGFSLHSKTMTESGHSYGIVAECWPCTTDAAHRARLLADAKLIAAAPDLLSCVEATMRILDGWGPDRRGMTLELLHAKLSKTLAKVGAHHDA